MKSVWIPLNPIDDKWTLIQVMACCHQAKSHYLRQCWPRPLLSYGHDELIHWEQGRMVDNLHVTILNAFSDENFLMQFVTKGSIDNKTLLVWVMAGTWIIGDGSLTHIYDPRPRWVNGLMPGVIYSHSSHVIPSGVRPEYSMRTRALSQYKDRLSQVWGFPC